MRAPKNSDVNTGACAFFCSPVTRAVPVTSMVFKYWQKK